MRRSALLLAFLLLLTSCGGDSDATPATASDGGVDSESTTTTAAVPGEPASRDVGSDPVCAELGDWMGAIAFGGATNDIYSRVRTSASALPEPYRAQVEAAVAGDTLRYPEASAVDVDTLVTCQFPLVEGALVAALNGQPDCYLDGDRQVLLESLCAFGGRARTAGAPAEIDAFFCGTVQDFNRSGAGSASGQSAIEELNRFVDAAPAGVERPLRDIVDALAADDTEALLRSSLEVDRVVSWGCDDSVAGDYIALARAAIAAVPPPTTAVAAGEEPEGGPDELAGGSAYTTLCQAIDRRFSGSAYTEWALVLGIARDSGAPADVISILSQLADPEVKGEDVRAPLVAALQPFLDGPCQNTGLDQAAGDPPPGEAPPNDGATEDPDEDDDIPEEL
ncbi:MAG: hypothetical protein ACR2QE_11040 [Acidimicrobiales bacterium]